MTDYAKTTMQLRVKGLLASFYGRKKEKRLQEIEVENLSHELKKRGIRVCSIMISVLEIVIEKALCKITHRRLSLFPSDS